MRILIKIIICIHLFFLFGCKSYQYVTSSQYIPLHEKKGEIKTNISFNTIKIGYSVSNHIGLFAEYNKRDKDYVEKYTGAENSGRIGGYNKIEDRNFGICLYKARNNFRSEILLGAGYGNIGYSYDLDEWMDNDYRFSFESKKTNIFLQPNFGYKLQDGNFIGEIGVFSRIYFTRLKNIKTSYFNKSSVSLKNDHNIFLNRDKVDFYFLEPGLFLKTGIKYISLQMILSPKIICLNNKYLYYRDFNFYWGININLNLFK